MKALSIIAAALVTMKIYTMELTSLERGENSSVPQGALISQEDCAAFARISGALAFGECKGTEPWIATLEQRARMLEREKPDVYQELAKLLPIVKIKMAPRRGAGHPQTMNKSDLIEHIDPALVTTLQLLVKNEIEENMRQRQQEVDQKKEELRQQKCNTWIAVGGVVVAAVAAVVGPILTKVLGC